MPAKSGPKPKQDDYSAGLWQLAGEMSKETPYLIQFTSVPTSRKGVWFWRCRALHQVDGHPFSVVCQVVGEYPNSRHESLQAFLYNLAHKLDAELARAVMEGGAV